jgi:hypothetical protein
MFSEKELTVLEKMQAFWYLFWMPIISIILLYIWLDFNFYP